MSNNPEVTVSWKLAQHMQEEVDNLNKKLDSLRKLCGISAAIIRKQELTAERIVGSHVHVHKLREVAGDDFVNAGIRWLEQSVKGEK